MVFVMVGNVALGGDITFDYENTGHSFDGLGAQIWSGDMSVEPLLADLKMRYIRMELGPNWNNAPDPPTGQSRESFDAYVAANYGAARLQNMKNTAAMLDSLGIESIFNQFHVPPAWQRIFWPYELRSANYQDFAILWGAMLAYLDSEGIRPEYVELFNEPDGAWNCRVSPAGYNTVVKLVRAEMDYRDFEDVQIVGPGLAYLNHNSGGRNYINALDSEAVEALGGFSAHAWDETFLQGCGPEYLRQQWIPFGNAIAAKDPQGQLPIFITEYKTGNRRFHGVDYPRPGENYPSSAASTMPFAVRVFENTLSLINSGASVPIIWEAADKNWEDSSWGLQMRPAQASARRPSYYALKVFADIIPPGSQVITAGLQPDNDIYLAGFVTDTGVALAAVNSTNQTKTKAVAFTNTDHLELIGSMAYSAAGFNNGSEMFYVAHDKIFLEMPADSVLAISLETEHVESVAEKVLHWKFEGNLEDSTDNHNHATDAQGGFSFAAGKFGQGLVLDGTDMLIELVDGTNLPLAADQDWSISLWIYPDQDISAGGDYHGLAFAGFGSNSWDKNGNARYIGNWGWGSGISFYSTTMVPTSTGVAYDSGRWQLITITYQHQLWTEQGTDTAGAALKIYKDADLIASFNPQGRYYAGGFSAADNIVSLLPDIPDQADVRFTGKLDEFAIYRGALSPAQVQSMALRAAVPGDLNGDGVVDIADLAVLSSFWLDTGNDGVADLNGDNIVNFVDFAMWANQYLQ